MEYQIPFNKPFVIGPELYYIARSVLSGKTCGDGPYAKACEALIEKTFGISHALLTTSCTSALEIASILCDIQPGDEVILPSFNAASAANTFLNRGARLVFADIRPDTLNIDERTIPDLVTERTRAIVPRHYAGIACEMDELMRIARERELFVIEDVAEGFNAQYRGQYLGGVGHIGAYSFHETKDFSCGEGGALVTNDDALWERAEVIREKGTNRSQFFRGQVDKYTWVDIGSSYVPSDILAAFLYAQLEKIDTITAARRQIYEWYQAHAAPLVERGLIEPTRAPEGCHPNYHNFVLLARSRGERDGAIAHLKERGTMAVFHFQPLHLSPMGEKLGYRHGAYPVTEEMADRVLRLPFYHGMGEAEVVTVIGQLTHFFDSLAAPPATRDGSGGPTSP